MANKTANYGLTKPLPEEFYDVAVPNTNMDIIDAELKKKYDPNNLPTPALIGALPLEGGTLTGDLSVKKNIPVQRLDVNGSQKMSYWQKNATASVDYGTVIADGSTADDRTELHIAHDSNAFKLRRIESGSVVGDYPIYHTGNKPTVADIGAAPAGYGLGGSKSITWDEIDSTYAPGWYHISGANTICEHTANYWYLFVSAWSSGSQHATHILYSISAATKIFLRTRNSGEWGDWKDSSPSAFVSVDEIGNYDKVLCAVYGETTLAEISEAIQAGKFVYCDFSGMFAPCMGGIGGLFFTFCCGNDKDGYSFSIDTSGWSYTTYGGFTPKAHADSHKTGGKDALTPADIGASGTLMMQLCGQWTGEIAKNGYSSKQEITPTARSGYTFLYPVTFGSNSSYFCCYGLYYTGGKIQLYGRNVDDAAITPTVDIYGLYIKN